MHFIFNLASTCYLHPLGYAVDARYGTNIATRYVLRTPFYERSTQLRCSASVLLPQGLSVLAIVALNQQRSKAKIERMDNEVKRRCDLISLMLNRLLQL